MSIYAERSEEMAGSLDFPKLMISKSGCNQHTTVILAVDERHGYFSGTIVLTNDPARKHGEFAGDFDFDLFHDYDGTITLRNER